MADEKTPAPPDERELASLLVPPYQDRWFAALGPRLVAEDVLRDRADAEALLEEGLRVEDVLTVRHPLPAAAARDRDVAACRAALDPAFGEIFRACSRDAVAVSPLQLWVSRRAFEWHAFFRAVVLRSERAGLLDWARRTSAAMAKDGRAFREEYAAQFATPPGLVFAGALSTPEKEGPCPPNPS